MDEDGKQTKIAHSMVAKDGEVRTTKRALFFPFWSKKMKSPPHPHLPLMLWAIFVCSVCFVFEQTKIAHNVVAKYGEVRTIKTTPFYPFGKKR